MTAKMEVKIEWPPVLNGYVLDGTDMLLLLKEIEKIMSEADVRFCGCYVASTNKRFVAVAQHSRLDHMIMEY